MNLSNEPVAKGGGLLAFLTALLGLAFLAGAFEGRKSPSRAYGGALMGLAGANAVVTAWQRGRVWGPVTHQDHVEEAEFQVEEALDEGPPEDPDRWSEELEEEVTRITVPYSAAFSEDEDQ